VHGHLGKGGAVVLVVAKREESIITTALLAAGLKKYLKSDRNISYDGMETKDGKESMMKRQDHQYRPLSPTPTAST
jgi:hypothetical protein